MDKVSVTMTVFFEEAFWVGIVQMQEGQDLRVCKIVFGKEPSEQVVIEYITHQFTNLIFSPVAKVAEVSTNRMNPKRKQRESRKQMQTSISTKSQQLLKQQYLESKEVRKEIRKKCKEEKLSYLFALKQQKRKEKHKGH